MSHTKQRQSTGATNISQILSSEARLNRLHRLFKTHYDVTEPSVILEPYLFLGNCISAQDINRLSELGIRYILNVAIRDVEVCPYYSNDVRTYTIDLRDDDRENILRTFDQAFAFIDEAKRNNSRILVHCSHGQSRSPAIVIAYLMRTYNVSLEQCLVHVVKARACVLPNDGFLKQLILYDRFLVEKRRRHQETTAKKVVENTSTTEISIQQNSVVVSKPPTPTQNPVNKPSNEIKISSIDSSSTQSPTDKNNNTSIHVIPIQVSSKKSHAEKIEPIPIRKIPVADLSPKQDLKKENTPTLIPTSKSNREITSKKRQSVLITNIVNRPSSHSSRSHSVHNDRITMNHYNIYSPSPCTQQKNVNTYYPTSKEQKPVKYITEIYDKATNRYIPAKC